MPILDNELPGGSTTPQEGVYVPKAPLGSPETMEISKGLGGFENFGKGEPKTGMSLEDISRINVPNVARYDSPFEVVPQSTLIENKRYAMYQKDVDLENIYGLGQSWQSQLANGVVKMAATAVGTFAQSFATIPDTISAISTGKLSELTGGEDGYEGSIDMWLKNIEDKFPNYMTRHEQEHPFLAAIPGFAGSANFWGNMVIKNLGFTVGAIGGALAQDAIIGTMTGGAGLAPLAGTQFGKAALALNKLFSEAKDLDAVLDVAKVVGANGKTMLNAEKLMQAAALTKMSNGLRYGLNLYGASRTEAGVEARDGFRQVKDTLIAQYKTEHMGDDPTPQDLKEIEEYATDAMNTRFGINMALLTVSNAIQFDNLFKVFNKASATGVTGTLTKKIQESGKIGLKEGSVDEFEKKVATTVGGKLWDSVKPALPTLFSEGVYEEGGQYAAERGTYDYYTRKYKNLKDPRNRENWNSMNEIVNSTTQGLADQFGTTEGIQNMMVGAITAMLTGAGMGVTDRLKGQGPNKRLDTAVNILNQYGLTGTLGDKFENTLNTVGITREMEDAVKSGDIYKYKNLKHDLFFNYVMSRIPSGMHDVTVDQLNMLKDLSKEEFQKTFGMDFNESSKKTVNDYVDSLITEADKIHNTVKGLDATFRNPFTYNDKAEKDSPEELENRKFNTFNKWKTDLAYYASVAPNTNSRLESIGQDLIKINPLLGTDVLSKLTNADSLRDLLKEYNDKAEMLDKTIMPGMTSKEKRTIETQSKTLRSMAQRIGVALENDHDIKSFNTLLNFELNNQDGTKDAVIPTEKTLELMIYSKDINRLVNRKKVAADIFDKLSDKEGLEKYFKQAEEMVKETEEETAKEGTPPVHTFVNRAGEQEALELDREYESEKLPDVTPVKVGKQWKVTNPITGVSTLHKTKKDAQEEADYINAKQNATTKFTIVQLNKDGTVKVEDQQGYIYDIPLDKLKGYAKIQTEQEKLQKDKEDIEKEQEQIELKSGEVNTGDPTTDKDSVEPKKKSAWIFFKSGITESEMYNDPEASTDAVKRSRIFLNTARDFKNAQGESIRGDLRAILVTPNNEEALGLKGLTQLSYQATDAEAASAAFNTKVRDLQNGFIAQVFVLQEGDKFYFVDVNGKKINEVRQTTDVTKVVFQTMPTTKEFDSRNVPRARDNQKEEFEANRKAWATKRDELFQDDGSNDPVYYKFNISRGIPKVNNVKDKNHVGGILVSEEDIATNNTLIKISVDGSVSHQGDNYQFSKGRTVLQNGDVLQFINNNMFTAQQAETVYEVIRALADDIIKQSKAGKKIKFNEDYANFLKNVLFFNKKAPTSKNQMYVNTANMTINLGGTEYDITKIADSRTEIIDHLKETYHNINKNTLEKEFSDTFVEYVFDGTTLQELTWTNYQTYLLSSRTHDGKGVRDVASTPLTTNVARPSTSVPVAFEQKYATMYEFELPVQQVAPSGPVKISAGTVIIDGYPMDNSVQTFKLNQGLSADFKGTVENGRVKVEIVQNEKIGEIAKDPERIKGIIKWLKDEGMAVDDTMEDATLVNMYLERRIANGLNEKLAAQPAQQPAAQPAPQPSVPSGYTAEVIDKIEKLLDGLGVLADTNDVKTLLSKAVNNAVTEADIQAVGVKNNVKGITDAVNQLLATLTPAPAVQTQQTQQAPTPPPPAAPAAPAATSNEAVILKYLTDVAKFELLDDGDIPKMLASVLDDGTIDPEEIAMIFGISKSKAKTISADIKKLLPDLKPYRPNIGPGMGNANQQFRRAAKHEAGKQRMTEREIELFKAWIAKVLPKVSYKVMDNLINTFDNEEAWGVFEEGVIKFYKKSIRGTEYHEVGEAIWNAFLSPEERQELIDEFRNSAGSFTDRESNKSYKKDDPSVTDEMIKERIMDDFSEFRLGKLPARTLGEKILRFFRAIIDFFKNFGSKPSLKTQLFEAIEAGKFKDREVSEAAKKLPPAYSKVEGISETLAFQYVQDMAIRSIAVIFTEDKKGVFNPEKVTGQQVFNKVRDSYIRDGKYYEVLTPARFKQLFNRTRDFLRTLGINFNEEDLVDINDMSVDNRMYAAEPFSTDWKKYSPYAIRIIASAIPRSVPLNQEGKKGMVFPAKMISDVNGFMMNSFSQVFATLLDKFSNTTSMDRVQKNLEKLAKQDSNYTWLFDRLGGNMETGEINFKDFKAEDWRLFVQFYQTFTKQRPEALIQFVSGNDVYTAAADQFSAAKEKQKDWFEMMKSISKEPTSIIVRDKQKMVYRIKRLNATKPEKQANGKWLVTDYNGDSYLYNTEKEAKDGVINLSFPVKTLTQMVAFLNAIGVDMTEADYFKMNSEQRKSFEEATASIRTYIQENPEVGTLRARTLTIHQQLNTLANLWVNVNNPNKENVHINVDGTKSQTYSENNTASVFENEFNEASNLTELLRLRPELNDVFSKNSVKLQQGGLFFDAKGKRVKGFKVSYIEGRKDINNNKGTSTSKLSIGERFTQEINQNLNGNYYVLVPADASTEWMLNLGNSVSFKDVQNGKAAWNKIYSIFRGYLTDDVAVALDYANREDLKSMTYTDAEGKSHKRAKDLRFFKDILPAAQLAHINGMIHNDSSQAAIEEYINLPENTTAINEAVKSFIESTVAETQKILIDSGQITYNERSGRFAYKGLDNTFVNTKRTNPIDKFSMDQDELTQVLMFANSNYIINNIELHKLIFGDPYQFDMKDGKLDETKRIKSFLSPRRRTFDTPEFNSFLNSEYNMVDGVILDEKEIGYHKFKDHAKTVTIKDIKLNHPFYKKAYEETDGASFVNIETYREIKLKNGQWTTKAETWYQWQMAYTRQNLPGYQYKNEALRARDKMMVSRPEPDFVTEVMKPIVSGTKAGETKINLVLDKFSQMPIYYKAVEKTNLAKLYEKMHNEGVDYVVFGSARKVGTEKAHSLYDSKGRFNEEGFADDTIVKVPWKVYGIQVENSFESPHEQTRGSQITKLASLDMFENGRPIGKTTERQAVIEAEYNRNLSILKMIHTNAYNMLLKKMGIEDKGPGVGFKLVDPTAISKALEDEMFRRQLSENAKDTILLDKDGQFVIPFEASPAYVQVRNILYSMINKSLVSIKTSGGPKVQVPVTLWENSKEGRGLIEKTKDGYKKITLEQYETMSDERKANVRLASDKLKFYTEDDPYCEVMLPHWFRDAFDSKRFPTDESILNYLNNHPDGKEILTGIGFRIPTQAMSSVEVFRVKGFLPKSMGDTVVVPSEITAKAGSDFDIDKLNTYLKSVYVDESGNVNLVRYQGSEEATKEFFKGIYEGTIQREMTRITEFDDFRDDAVRMFQMIETLGADYEDTQSIENTFSEDDYNFYVDHRYTLLQIANQAREQETTASEYLMNQIERFEREKVQLSLDMFNEDLKEKYVNDMYRKSLENMYYDSLEKLITLPENFDRLISPIDDAGLKDAAAELDELRGVDETDIQNRLLNRNFLSSLRHSFVVAKRWVGIAAVNITGHSNAQKSELVIDPNKFAALDKADRELLGDGKVILPHNEIDGKISMSGRTVKGGTQFISDRLSGYATAFVDVAKDPYIMKIITSDLAIGTFMFLERIGCGKNTAKFMNQPVIVEYMAHLESQGKRYLFNTRTAQKFLEGKFPTSEAALKTAEIDMSMFDKNISKYASKQELTEAENAQQHLVLQEFLKYAKMAEFSLEFTMASNYDTAKFTSSDSWSRKKTKTELARTKNIFSDVDTFLDSTYVGDQKELLDFAMASMGAALKLEQEQFRNITGKVMKNFEEKKFMSQDDFDRVAAKVKASFLDYILHTKLHLNEEIEALTVLGTSVADQLEAAKTKYPNMKILNDLVIRTSDRIDGPKTIKLSVNIKDAYDENIYIEMMRELKETDPVLYGNIVKLAMLQGTYQTVMTYKNIIPVEDYASEITPIINNLVADPELEAFTKGMFQRANWRDETIVPTFNPKLKEIDFYINDAGYEEYQFDSPNVPHVPGLNNFSKHERNILLISTIYDPINSQHDFIKVPRTIALPSGVQVDFANLYSLDRTDFAKRQAVGDLTLKDYYGYQRIMDGDKPLITNDGQYVYKLVNLWGDGAYVTEMYPDHRKSVLNNGTVKVEQEIDDQVIIDQYAPKPGERRIQPAPPQIGRPVTAVPVETLETTIEKEVAEEAAATAFPQATEEVYSKLGNKTVSENVIVPGEGDLANLTYTGKNFWDEIVPEARGWYENDNSPLLIAYRGNKNKTFVQNYKNGTVGNPFNWQKYGHGTSLKMFIDWILTGNNYNDPNATAAYRDALIADFKSGKWKRSMILYYVERNAPSHATALDYFINKYDWGTEKPAQVGGVIALTENFTRQSVENDPEYMYLFTDNAGRTSGGNLIPAHARYSLIYGEGKRYPSTTQAVIRGLDNAFPIATMVDDKRTQWTDDNFVQFKAELDADIAIIKAHLKDFKGIKFSAQMPFGQGQISKMKTTAPKSWAYLNEKLAELGIDNTGSKPVATAPTVAKTEVQEDVKELLARPYKGYANALWYYFVEKAKLNDPSKVDSIVNAKDYHAAYLIGKSIPNTEASEALLNSIVDDIRNPKETEQPEVKRKYVLLENRIVDFEPSVQALFNTVNPTIEQYDEAVGNYQFDLSAEISDEMRAKIESMLRDVQNSFEINRKTPKAVPEEVKKDSTIEEKYKNHELLAELPVEGKAVYIPEFGFSIEKGSHNIILSNEDHPEGITLANYFDYNNITKDNWTTLDGTDRALAYWHFVELQKDKPLEESQEMEAGEAIYKYYGKQYFIHTMNGKGVDVAGYKGKNVDKQKLLDAFNANPNVDPQNGKPFTIDPTFEFEEEEEIPIDERAELDNPETNHKGTFTYKGKTIETQFALTGSQQKALEELADFVSASPEQVITLQGAAGTGKTSVIGYLQNYMGRRYNFVYMAPTHAAVAELAFATIRTGNKSLPMTVQSAIMEKFDPISNSYKTMVTRKLKDKLALTDNVIVIDESSMLSAKDYDRIKKVAESNDLKIIFMGDILQIPEVNPANPEKKLVSKAFTDNKQVTLTEVKRTSNDTMLRALGYIRDNTNGKIPVVQGSEDLQYMSDMMFNRALANTIREEPEDTMLISYTNNSVKAVNNKIRKALGFEGNPIEGAAIVGYSGYNTKQIEKQNVANSIRYVITGVTKHGSEYLITAKSKKLAMLSKAGVDVSQNASTMYMQLSPNDSLTFDTLTQEDFDRNNKKLSSIMDDLLDAKKTAKAVNTGVAWSRFYAKLDAVGKFFMEVNLGGDYIYNPATKQMEEADYGDPRSGHAQIKKDFSEMAVDKGIDYGYAVTIHKSQGTTVKNVFFDASTLPRSESSKLYSGGKQVSTEKHALLYVGMSRASGKLVVNNENPDHFYMPEQEKSVSLQQPTTPLGKFYMSLTADQKAKLGSLEELQAEFDRNPFKDYSEDDFIDELKCRL